MGWCSGTEIFDGVIDLIDSNIEQEKMLSIVEKLADLLWDMDWDCESDSKYFKELLYPIMLRRGYIDEDDWDEV